MAGLVTEIVGSLALELLIAGVSLGVGFVARRGWDLYKRHRRLRHHVALFGDVYRDPEEILVVLPVFDPESEDNFAEAETRLIKREPANANGTVLRDRLVPLYSQVLVLDDYRAYKFIEDLFDANAYGEIPFSTDLDARREWKRRLILCFGGPRSNLKLRQVLNLARLPYVEFDEDQERLDAYQVRVASPEGPKGFVFRPDPGECYGYVFKVTNPVHPQGKVIAVAGDTAFSTQMAARYLAENVSSLAERHGTGDFLVLLTAHRGSYDTLRVALDQPLAELEGLRLDPPPRRPAFDPGTETPGEQGGAQ